MPATSSIRGLATAAASGRAGKARAKDSCPLHACLLRHGITDLGPFSTPKHLGLSQEVVSSKVEPKLAALAAEGLSPAQMARLLAAKPSPLPCSYGDTFQPNLELLRSILAFSEYQPHPQAPQLTAVGRVLAGAPGHAAMYLLRDHAKIERLVRWLGVSLGIGLAQLAGCKALCDALCQPVDSAQAVCLLLLGQEVAAEEVAHVFLAQPTLFGRDPKLPQARLGCLQRELGLDAAAALQLAVQHPRLLAGKLEASLPPLLGFLDVYMGEEGAGRRLVLRQPVLGTISAQAAKRAVSSLAARGYSQEQIRGMISKYPTLLKLDLASPTQQQKLEWISTVSPWTPDHFLASPSYLSITTRRLASRLDFMRQHDLALPDAPAALATTSNARFMSMMCKRLAKQGRQPAVADWAGWEGAWLRTEAGKKWGYPPLAY
jgi:hypothetical protein